MAIHIKNGSQINGYRLITNMTTSDAGTSMWAFAEKQGYQYFIKCYLTPTYPNNDSPGSTGSKERKRERCRQFEQHVNSVESALLKCGDDNFLVRAADFFRQDGVYFKVTKKLRSSNIEVERLSLKQQMLILLSAAYGIKSLHENSEFVHADIKPENFIFHRNGDRITAHLIDFDAGFFSDAPPSPEDLIGDQRYWAPEFIRYHDGDPNEAQLTQKLDVFAVGILFCEFLTGRMPIIPSQYNYLGEALLDGHEPEISPIIHQGLQPLALIIQSMLCGAWQKRPSMEEVHDSLRHLNKKAFVSDKTYINMTSSVIKELTSELLALNPLEKYRLKEKDSESIVKGWKQKANWFSAGIRNRLQVKKAP